jgi:hypothetical protein
MPSIPPDLPPPPQHWYRFGWRGFSLILPNDWNLQLHDGNDKKGALVFSDLRCPRVELRWQSPREPEAVARKTLQRKTPPLHTTLLPLSDRLYELHFPAATPPEIVNTLTNDFRQTLPTLANHPQTLWQLYGLSAWLPRSAKLQSASLLPGQTTLTFKDYRGGRAQTLTLASYSLADRLLHQKTLKQWAQQSLPDLTRHPDAHWHESPTQTTLTLQTRRLLRKTTHHLTLTHDQETNRLTYTHEKS